MRLKNKRAGIIILIVLCVLMAILIGPMDYFRHGHYYEEYDFTQIAEEDWEDQISLENEAYEMEFSPVKDYLNGFSIFLYNQPDDNEGSLVLTITDEKGKVIDRTKVDLSKPQAGKWYKTYIDSNLKKDKVYKLQFTVHDCKYYPYLQNVDDDYLPEETQSGSILIAYSYAQPTFTFQERSMIVLLILAFILMLIGGLIPERKKLLNSIAIVIFLTLILSWNYMHNSMDNANTMYAGYQIDSETLVSNVISAEQDGEYYREDDEIGFGLGRYYDLKGAAGSYDRQYMSNENWSDGYSLTEAAIIVNSNDYTKEVAVAGNIIEFSNGEEVTITGIDDDGTNIVIHLDYPRNLIPLKFGDLDDAVFYDANHNVLHKGRLNAYKSQYGLQGKAFRHLARHMKEDNIINNLYLICCFCTALVFVLITLLIAKKYNKLLASCFFVTFWLSPWIICFARNLYWVEFTWFIPMLVGVFCTWKIEDKRCRWASYVACIISVCLKCLCGYEYISVVMMGLISFLLVDAALALIENNKEKAFLIIRTIIVLGVLALAGFMLAIIIHAKLKGNGDIAEGIKEIIEKDVLRRTNGADLNDFDPVYWPSFNASVWETYSKYFKFGTEIITGITGNLFPLLCIIPLCIFGMDYKNNKLNVRLPIMYVVFFLTSISWFCLAKGHSFIHTHMNYVLWYFGFIQVCFYVILDKIVKLYKKSNVEKKE